MEPGVFLIIIIVAVVIGLIAMAVQSSNKQEAQQSASNKISKLGIQQSTIKQTDSRIYHDAFSMPQGVLTLTWDKLYFFGSNIETDIPISSIRSISSENKSNGTLLVILSDSGTYRFYWQNLQRATRGLVTDGQNIGAGYGRTSTNNPIVQEWIQIIDDIRFGRIKKPN
jgi:hypothetical protein